MKMTLNLLLLGRSRGVFKLNSFYTFFSPAELGPRGFAKVVKKHIIQSNRHLTSALMFIFWHH